MPGEGGSRVQLEDCGLTRLTQLAALPAETLSVLAGIGRVRHFQAGQIVAEAGDEPQFIGCVLHGILRMQKILYDGRQHIVGLLVEGDIFGRVFDGPLEISIEAATDTEICAFQRAPFESLLLRSPELERVVLLNLLNELDRARDWMIILANPRVKGRLAAFLLILCTRFASVDHLLRPADGTLEVKIPISRADLAHLLGTSPESISRAFRALSDGGSIALKRPNLIEIRDIQALGAEAGEEDIGSQVSLKDILQAVQRRA